jgi:hypothetical protein
MSRPDPFKAGATLSTKNSLSVTAANCLAAHVKDSPMNHARTLIAALAATASLSLAGPPIWSSDFEGSLPAEVSPGVATTTGVRGYAGLGHDGNRFDGSFLRSPTGNRVTITLTDLPAHDSVSLDFLFAAIDSLDGTGSYPEGDFLNVTIDGVTIFRESFANAAPTQFQSYVSASGVELARRLDLGFSGPGSYYTDSAYDMSLEPRFHGISHTAPTLTVSFIMEGPGIQSLDDESWAIDNLRISLEGGTPCPADFNQDGGIDGSDVAAFFLAWEASHSEADVNQDGGIDGSDVSAFFEYWESGC